MKPEDEDQCVGCGRRYYAMEKEELFTADSVNPLRVAAEVYHQAPIMDTKKTTRVRGSEMGSGEKDGRGARFYFCIRCCMTKKPLPIPFQCLFGHKKDEIDWGAIKGEGARGRYDYDQ